MSQGGSCAGAARQLSRVFQSLVLLSGEILLAKAGSCLAYHISPDSFFFFFSGGWELVINILSEGCVATRADGGK